MHILRQDNTKYPSRSIQADQSSSLASLPECFSKNPIELRSTEPRFDFFTFFKSQIRGCDKFQHFCLICFHSHLPLGRLGSCCCGGLTSRDTNQYECKART